MTGRPEISLEDLYSPEILALATRLEQGGALDGAQGVALQVSRLCGSRVRARVRLDGQGRVAAFTQQVHACALGQAAAALLQQHVRGASLEELEQGRAALRAMLKDGAPPPAQGRWRDLAVLEPVRGYPPRHDAVLLPFDAAIAAVREALGSVDEFYPDEGADEGKH